MIFKNTFLERLTRTHIAVPLVLYSVISTGLIINGFHKGYINVLNTVLLFPGGFLTFTLVEYLMHRYIFHLAPKTEKHRKFVYKVHGVHHDYPKDKDRLAMPPVLSLILSALFFLLYRLIMGNLVYAFLAGFLMGYASYLWGSFHASHFSTAQKFLESTLGASWYPSL